MIGCIIIAGAIILAALIIADAVSPRERSGYQPQPGTSGSPPKSVSAVSGRIPRMPPPRAEGAPYPPRPQR